jgi:hypothetical protein
MTGKKDEEQSAQYRHTCRDQPDTWEGLEKKGLLHFRSALTHNKMLPREASG